VSQSVAFGLRIPYDIPVPPRPKLFKCCMQAGVKNTSHLPAYEDGTECSETSPGNNQKKTYSIQNTEAFWNQKYLNVMTRYMERWI